MNVRLVAVIRHAVYSVAFSFHHWVYFGSTDVRVNSGYVAQQQQQKPNADLTSIDCFPALFLSLIHSPCILFLSVTFIAL